MREIKHGVTRVFPDGLGALLHDACEHIRDKRKLLAYLIDLFKCRLLSYHGVHLIPDELSVAARNDR